MNSYFILGCLFWGIVVGVLFFLRPNAILHQICIENLERKHNIFILFILIVTVLGCTIPMCLSPIWNGIVPEHRNQYEVMAQSILEGHLYLDYGEIDAKLLEMENPYDPQARTELSVEFKGDHAFYNGRYYMYFGVVPVFLVFLPYLIITGTSLTTYHATQIFTALFICGLFLVLYLIAKRFFKQMTVGVYLSLSVGFSIMSVWYSMAAPALYCTAIMSALCMVVWSLYFFMRAVWVESEQKKTIAFAFMGSLCGALAFGCRPSTAMANIFVIPLLVEYLQKRKINFKLIRELIFAASPYVIVAILLMIYNYVRFENPFEFGQAYQLTLADQSNYGNFFERFDFVATLDGLIFNFFEVQPISSEFPFFSHSGIMINFPIIWLIFAILFSKNIRKQIREQQLTMFIITMFVIPIAITIVTVVWTPFLAERYRSDIYWIMGILCFMVVGFMLQNISEKRQKIACWAISWLGVATAGKAVLLFLVPINWSFTYFYKGALRHITSILTFGIGA